MQEFVLINGYGVPKDIFKDDSYRTYLNHLFNVVYESSVREGLEPVIIFSGGKTDMFKPYQRTEAGEMAKYFKALAKRPFVAKVTKTWKYELESRALSSLENMLFARELLKKKYPRIKSGTIAFEQTRAQRIQAVAKEIFNKSDELTFLPIEFDISVNRYDLELVDKKEKYALKMDLWSLESTKNLKMHHDVFADKIKTLRQAGPVHHQEAVQEWWKKSLQRVQEAGLT
jgi:uncharacterized phage-like protein YoqJ